MANLTTSYQLVGQAELGKVYNSNKAYIRIYAKYNSQSISSNSSNVSLQARVYSESTWYSGKTTTYRIKGSGGIDSGSISYTTSASDMYPKNAERTLGTITKDISHNADGTKTIYAEANFYSSPWGFNATASSGTTLVLPTIPRQANIATAPDFNDEQNPTITYSNPAGNSVSSLEACISLTGSKDDIPYRSINKTGTLSYTFNLTEEERNILRQATTTSNSRTIYFYIRTIIGGVTYHSKVSKTFSIINANPIFNDFVFEDINEQTLALTGDNQSVIAGYSDVKVTIPLTNKAIAQKQATISKYRFNSIDANYSDAEDVSIISNKVINGDFTVYAIDSRGNSTSKTKNALNVVNYTPLVKDSIVAQRQNGVSPTTTLKFNGKWWNGIFGQKPASEQLRNIQIGDDLSGKKIYCTFDNEYQFYVLLEKVGTQNILKTDNSNLIQSFTEENNNGYEAFVIANGTNLYYGNSDTQEETNLPTYTLPDDFGIVTEINEYALAYGNIFVEDDNVTYEDVKNTIIAKYRYSLAGEENYFDGNTPIELVVDEENYSFEGLIAGDLGAEGFDISNAYNIQVIVEDELSQVVFTANLGSGTPHIAYAKNGVGIMGAYDEEVGGLLQVGGKPIQVENSNEVIWEGTLLGDNEINVDLTDCQRIRVYASAYYGNFVFEIDLTKKTPAVYISGYPYIGGETTRTTDLGTSFYTCLCGVNSEKTKFRHLAVGYGNANGWNSRINTNNYYVYKIEKVGITEITHKHEFESNEIYLMEEQRVGTWVNNKPIYRKIYIFGKAEVNVGNNVDVSSLNIDDVIRLDGISKSSQYPAIPMNYYNDGKRNCIYIDGQIMMYIVGWVADQVIINIEYTKTTD